METWDGIEEAEPGSGIVPTAALDEVSPTESMFPSSEEGGREAELERSPPEILCSP